jgi:hypothetical protein
MSDFELFITEDSPTVGAFEVHFQFPTLRVTLHAADSSFAQKLLDFIKESKGNPAYFDEYRDGRWRAVDKWVDLSSSFPGLTVSSFLLTFSALIQFPLVRANDVPEFPPTPNLIKRASQWECQSIKEYLER